jgi:hypothetical protein
VQDAQKARPARPQGATKDDPSKLARVRYPRDGPDESPTAHVQRGSSETARCASTGDSPGHPIPCWRDVSASCSGFLPEEERSVQPRDGDGDEFDCQQQSAHHGIRCGGREDEMQAEEFGSL